MRGRTGYFGTLGLVLLAFVDSECARVGVPAGPLDLGVRPAEVDETPMACGAADETHSDPAPAMIRLACAPDLAEETVLLAERAMPAADRGAFRRERNRLYELPDADQREEQFRALHLRWFTRLGLHHVVETVVSERSELAARLTEGRVRAHQELRAGSRELVADQPVDRV